MGAFVRLARLAPLALVLVAACGRGQSAEERQMAQMRDEMNHLEAERDRVDERLSALELHAADNAPRASADPAGPTPELRVVRLSPEDQAPPRDTAALDGEDPDDTTPRPSIRVAGVGDARAKRHAGRDDVVETVMPPDVPNGGASGPSVRADVSRASALDPDARSAYEAALALVHTKKYSQALDAFAAFLLKWPDHPFAANAMYWRGECYFAQGDLARAAEQFDGTVARFPLSNKAADALLKLGVTRQKLGDAAGAQTAFDRLAREFPKSDAARRIPGAKP